ncbi:MAG: PD-(D/E)XK nuclease family protein [Myxococcales bacterium]|nr:PD-(D/E)XK nuclease family protein [Myxococcales bacterium]
MRVLRLTTSRGKLAHRFEAARDSQGDDAAYALWDWAEQATPPELRAKLVGPIGEVLRDFLVASSACEQLDLRESAGLHRSIARLLRAAEAVGLPVASLQKLGKKLHDQAGTDPNKQSQAARVSRVAALCALSQELLGKRGLSDERLLHEGLRRRAQQLAQLDLDAIEISGLHLAIGGPEQAALPSLLLALDVLLQAGHPIKLLIPSVEDRPQLQRAIKPIFDALYRRHELPLEEESVPLGPYAQDDSPWARFVCGLFRPLGMPSRTMPGELSELLSLHPVSSPQVEAQAVVAKVHALLSRGVPAHQIAIVAQTKERRERLISALFRAGIPTTPLAKLRAVQSAPASPLPSALRLILQIYEVLALGLPRESLLQLVTSRYLRFPGPLADKPWLLAQAMRSAGVRSLRHPRKKQPTGSLWDQPSDGEPTWGLTRLRTWLSAQAIAESQRKRSKPSHLQLVAEQADAVLRELQTLPEEATIFDHCRALDRLLHRLGFFDRTQALPELLCDEDSASADVVTQLMAAHQRDETLTLVLTHALSELPQWARKLGSVGKQLSQRAFATLLKLTLERLWEQPLSVPRPHAISVGELSDIPSQTFAQLLICGLIDGELPAYHPDDGLLPDADRRLIEQQLGRSLFPLAQHEMDAEPLKLAVALAHTSSAHLFWPQSDEEGRPVARSLFIDDIIQAASLPVPSVLDARSLQSDHHLADLWQTVVRFPSLVPTLSSLDRSRVGRIVALSRIEEQRSRFFALAALPDESASSHSHPFVGRILDESLIGVLQPRLPGSPQHPLSASVLEDFARCPFRFFARRVLGLRPMGEGGEELDPLASGRLHHAVLEAFFKDRVAAHRLPLRADDSDRQALDEAISVVVADFTQKEHIGHPELLKVRVMRLRSELWRLVEQESKEPPDPDCQPALFEWQFGPLAIAAAQGDEGRMALHIHGIIDRVDLGTGKAVVLDYKAGRRERYQHYLKHELLKTSFQLPLYVAALRADPTLNAEQPLHHVTARYYSLRQGKVTQALDNAEMTTLDRTIRLQHPDGNVAEVAYRLWRRLRDGDFAIRPQTCEGCGLESVCRIGAAPLDSDEDSDDQTSSSTSSASSADSSMPSQLSPTLDVLDGDNP